MLCLPTYTIYLFEPFLKVNFYKIVGLKKRLFILNAKRTLENPKNWLVNQIVITENWEFIKLKQLVNILLAKDCELILLRNWFQLGYIPILLLLKYHKPILL